MCRTRGITAYFNLFLNIKAVTFVMPIAESPELKNRFFIGADNKLAVVKWDAKSNCTEALCTVIQVDPCHKNRLNDAKISPSRVLFMGSMGGQLPDGTYPDGVGSVYKLADCHISTAIKGMSIPNGIAWNKAETEFYIADSGTYIISKYNYDKKTGDLSNKSQLINWKTKNLKGFPDGMTIDETDNLWVATFWGRTIVCVSTGTGEVLRIIDIPTPQVTSAVFGGPNLDILYVTTAAFQLTEKEKREPGLLSGIYAIENLGVKGTRSIAFKTPKNIN